MIDFALDGTLQFYKNDSGKFAVVNGIDEFEQSIRLMIAEYMHDVIGESNKENIKNKIRLQVSRVARNHDRLEDISEVSISESQEKANVYLVNINYESNDTFEFQVSE